MHYHAPEHPVTSERSELLRQFGFAGATGLLLLLNVTGLFRTVAGVDTAVLIALAAGYKTFHYAISELLERRITADLAICIAVIAALAIGEYLAAAEAMFIMLVGDGLEGYAARRTESAILAFVEKMPHHATLLRDGGEIEVHAEDLQPGDLILVRAGERIAADGVVAEGDSAVDESAITGESVPRDKGPGSPVYCGTLNGNGLLRVRVTGAGEQTTLARVISLVREARANKAPVERLADRYARYFLPALLVVSGAVYLYSRDWLRTVSVLIVACPCALILATPAAMVSAIGGLARRGILVRGGAVLQQAARADALFLDKTGTLTEGRLEVIRVLPLGRAESEVLWLAAAAEAASDHPVARVIVAEARARGLDVPAAEAARVLPGQGVACRVGSREVRAGSAAFLSAAGVGGAAALLAEADEYGATPVLIAEGDTLAGAILLRDRPRAGAAEAIHELGRLELREITMLTGDRRRAAEAIAAVTGIARVEAELLPDQKLERIRAATAQGRVTAMVGDGINDAPALSAASVGIAVSGAADVAAEAADVVYLPRSLDRLPALFAVSRRAVRVAWFNIIFFAGVVNAVAVALAGSGWLRPVPAAIVHQVASLLVILNSLRLLRVPPSERHAARRFGLAGVRRWAVAVGEGAARRAAALWRERERYYRPAAIAAAALILLNGFYAVGPDEVGIVQRFGRRLSPPRPPGLHYKLPWPVDRLTRIGAARIRAAEIGFRTRPEASEREVVAYEWNAQHRAGRYDRKPEEAMMLSGDLNMMEITATVHYNLANPEDFLFGHADGDAAVRAAAESVLQLIATSSPLDRLLTDGRREAEQLAAQRLQERLNRYRAGVRVIGVKLLDVHPAVEVVDAFREVSEAYEDKNRLVNEAEGHRNEQVALARGNARARAEQAQAYRTGRANRALGDAARFTGLEAAYRAAPAGNDTRLFLETMEQVLPGRKKMIVDNAKGRRHLLLVEDGVEIGPAGPVLSPPPRPAERER